MFWFSLFQPATTEKPCFVWLFDTDCCYIVFERLRFQLPFSYCSISFFPSSFSVHPRTLIFRFGTVQVNFFLAFISFSLTHWHCYSRNKLFSIHIFLPSSFFFIVYIFRFIIVYYVSVGSHFYLFLALTLCVSAFFSLIVVCMLACLLVVSNRMVLIPLLLMCFGSVVYFCFIHTYILIPFCSLNLKEHLLAFMFALAFPFSLSLYLVLHLPIQFKIEKPFFVSHCLCVYIWFWMIVHECVFQLDCKAHTRAILIFFRVHSIVIIWCVQKMFCVFF